ncbi:hypothetical protein GUITHDRAFT_66393 [Guillardia theta CCMP2712]|uniref:Cation/H+ exchanger transmembrane domain-containing protein n=1 Tax=Guillardia theta (strain CCMP2712) TaxID=905079 RepID=L1JR94_GUITC|nr:hypothetical protein GUITHDRAFT_66393 [Guillardia theta CCMP2712]EKX50972.1 hypothetical protein GUITHDRAFT_66393 [Guillardia theta CCMP2712]|eukprot:XP_005837952.1 hypothetical protein GUITHDRAFT_66393 [Guillardia theta CCMP2712]
MAGGLSTSGRPGAEIAKAWFTFLVVSLAAKLVGPYFPRIGFPLITAYLVTGMIAGPYLLEIVKEPDVKDLHYINMVALAYITTSAGAELHIQELKPLIKALLVQTIAISIITFAIETVLVGLLSSTSLLAWINPYPSECRWAVATILASICIARSPATAIAIIKEMRCKGRLTSTMLGITVLSDVFVLISVSITTSLGTSSCKGMPFQGASLGIVIAMIVVSILIGIIIGYLFMGLMMFSRFEMNALIFPLGFLVFLGSSIFTTEISELVPEEKKMHLEPLLMCIVGGFICVNFSSFHHRFCHALQVAAPYIFVPFFTLVGASLDLKTFVASIGFALVVSIVRAMCIFAATSSSGWLVGQSKAINLTIWMTLISQAGFELGIASEIAEKFEGWGRKFQAVIISVVVINQLAGAVLCKLAFRWSGEAGKATGNEAHEEAEADPHAVHTADKYKALILGCTPSSKALSMNLLRKSWGVVMLASSEDEVEEVNKGICEWAVRGS